MSKPLSLFLLTLFLVACQQSPAPTRTHDTLSIKTHIEKPYNKEEDRIQNTLYLDSLFAANKKTDTFGLNTPFGGVHIGHLFTQKSKHAVVGHFINDSILNVVVLKQHDNNWDTLMNEKIWPTVPGVTFIDYVYTFSDFDGDNIPDLKVIKNQWIARDGEQSELWLYKNDKFVKVSEFNQIVNAEFDKNTGLIYSYYGAGCADLRMYFSVYKMQKNKIKKISKTFLDCCNQKTCDIYIEEKLHYKVPIDQAYRHVPDYFAEGVKNKCKIE